MGNNLFKCCVESLPQMDPDPHLMCLIINGSKETKKNEKKTEKDKYQTYINCYYFILAAMSRKWTEGVNPVLIIPEVDPLFSPQWEGLFNFLLVVHYVTASPKSAAIRCTPNDPINLVIDLFQPSSNWSVIIYIPNSFPKFHGSLLRFQLSPLVPIDTYCTFFFLLPLSLSLRVAVTFFLFLLICCCSISNYFTAT